MKVKIVYRNYKPLHHLYLSLQVKPPQGVEYVFPEPRRFLQRLLPVHRKLGDTALGRLVTRRLQQAFFHVTSNDADSVDLYHFAQLSSGSIPSKPYLVDFEHVSALANFSKVRSSLVSRVFCFLSNSCKVVPLTLAAQASLRYLLSAPKYGMIEEKVEVVYPALPNYYTRFQNHVDHSQMDGSGPLRLLFVGNHAYRKGLPELLKAFARLAKKYHDLELHVICAAPKRLISRYPCDRINWVGPSLSSADIAKRFYLPCDLFVLPTHEDTLGMAILHSLSCGTPVLTTKQFAAHEIIKDGYNGLFVRSDRLYLERTRFPCRESREAFYGPMIGEERILVNDLMEKIEYLYNNRHLLKEMGRRATEDFEPGGKFAIDVRNRKLGEIYRSCLCS
jgi:glycosyltransferase involved in cell wall biosynthesis